MVYLEVKVVLRKAQLGVLKSILDLVVVLYLNNWVLDHYICLCVLSDGCKIQEKGMIVDFSVFLFSSSWFVGGEAVYSKKRNLISHCSFLSLSTLNVNLLVISTMIFYFPSHPCLALFPCYSRPLPCFSFFLFFFNFHTDLLRMVQMHFVQIIISLC